MALTPQILVCRAAYDRALQTLYGLFQSKPELTLGEARDALGVSRKYALALLEYWDSAGITRKTGDLRTLGRRV